MVYNSTPILDPIDKVESLNSFFNYTFTVSHFTLSSMDQMRTPVNQLNHITVDESDILRHSLILIQPRLKGVTTCISPCASSLASPVTNLFTVCVSQCCLQQEWKIHKICPFLKKKISQMYQTLVPFLYYAASLKQWKVHVSSTLKSFLLFTQK